MIKTAILTISDSTFAGQRADVSGPALRQRCGELGWPVSASAILPDDPEAVSRQLRDWADGNVASLILTTGGTGISPRDNAPEATRTVLERELPGIGELMRTKGLEQTPFSVLSRALAGTRNRSFIVNLPGSPRGALHSLAAIEALIPHIIDLVENRTEH